MLCGKTMNGKPLVYLDNGATTFKPQSVIDRVTYFYTDITANIHRGDYEISAKADAGYDETRELVAEFINCRPEEVVFTSGATASLNIAAIGLADRLSKGDVVLITQAEHASNALPWFNVCEKTGAKIEFIPLDEEGRLTVDNFRKAMHDRVKIVAVASVGNVLGYIAPVKEICAIAHQYGALTVIDGAQSVPHRKTDVKDFDCDFLAFSSHKMCGPSGVGVLYGKYELLQQMAPAAFGGGANARFDSSCNVTLKDAPFKYEAGTPNIEGVLGLGAAIRYLQKIGMDEIAAHEKQLRDYLMEKLLKLDNVEIYNPHGDTGIIALNVKGIFSQDTGGYLNSQGIAVRSGNHCAKMLVDIIDHDDTVRVSLYFYNTEADCDALVEALKTCTIENCIGIFF